MPIKKKWLLAAIGMFVFMNASAGIYSGNEIYQYLSGDKRSTNYAVAQGYIAGAADAYHLKYCPPKGVTLGQLTDITYAFLKSNPERRHESADLFVGMALMEAFPCKTKP